LEETTVPFGGLGEKYGVSRQAIFGFCSRRGIKRPKRSKGPKREHTEECSICQGLIRIAKEPHSDFMSSHTIKKKLGLRTEIYQHIKFLKRKGLISKKFGNLRSRRVERAYQIYFKKRLPLRTIGRQVGLKNFASIIQKHKASGWDVPNPLYKYDRNERRIKLNINRRKKKGNNCW